MAIDLFGRPLYVPISVAVLYPKSKLTSSPRSTLFSWSFRMPALFTSILLRHCDRDIKHMHLSKEEISRIISMVEEDKNIKIKS